MSEYFKRFIEASRILLGQAVIVETLKASSGRAPKVTFKTMMDCYLKDAVFRDSIDLMTAQIVGAGFYTSCASEEEYKGATKAKELIDDWNKRNNLDGMLQVLAKELIATGSAIVEKVTPKKLEKLSHMPIYT